ncbi:LLM class flavin-dependent oxidoreductase [Roseovarius rhodophyticola]|uniref:LLM class flavin-dependent oxidoreductase n=1 Tax=Roseovarius rhodophyticola TaxID=3080827 RepID=A0ABZ2TAU3_9RHOB|nr:LLM class flavin-dependent oxidoreductase [Roseovarius sp. W115]MDV2930525.1 LLM class flavin-dependent oxidoreductase [Roseovarius sp. W115]
MKFSIVVNMARFDTTKSMEEVAAEALELVKIADQAGFDIIWTAEHHTIELTISPNPFQLLAHWANHTQNARLGTAVVAAPYWHPIRLAGEAAMCDILTGGRLELGLGRGAYQYEFDRMAGGMPQGEGGRYLREIIPAVQRLWEGDYAHVGELWNFPSVACVPKPIQKAPPMWVAARDQNTFEFALSNNCNVMSTALRKDFGEVEDLISKFDAARAAAGNAAHLAHATLRVCCVYDDPGVLETAVKSAINFGRNFENLFKNSGSVTNGFPEPVDFDTVAARGEYQPENLRDNLLFGTPDEVIEKLERYQTAGIDHIMIGPTFGLPHQDAARTIELFGERIIPHFKTKDLAA